MQEIVYCSVRLRCNTEKAFAMFTVNENLQTWLTEIADVEPKPGGKYELFWDPDDREHNSTIGCKVTMIQKHKLIAFEWKGPKQFKHFMNTAVPLTLVVVFFLPCDGSSAAEPCTEIHLIHSGWRDSAEWSEARSYFDKAWLIAFKNLEARFSNDD